MFPWSNFLICVFQQEELHVDVFIRHDLLICAVLVVHVYVNLCFSTVRTALVILGNLCDLTGRKALAVNCVFFSTVRTDLVVLVNLCFQQ